MMTFLYRMADNRDFFIYWLWRYWRINAVDMIYVITS